MMLRPDKEFTKLEAEVLDIALVLHMEHGGGTFLYGPNKEYFGVGHNSAYHFDGKPYFEVLGQQY